MSRGAFAQQISRFSSNSSPGAAAAAEAAQAQAERMAAKKPEHAGQTAKKIIMAMGVGFLCLPHAWVQAYHFSVTQTDDDANHKQANKWQEQMRAARRSSLAEFKEAYYGKEAQERIKADQPSYTPGVYWDRFNNTTIAGQKHNPNYVEKMKKKKSVGLYDTVGAVDKSRQRDGNEYRRKRSQTYMKQEDDV